ncbi:MAG: site-specific DNA-methyltransferase [Chloroflexi bacterium]|nr:site-specific DNA-methyltransferase [Chloroflexota bacterium]
MIFYDAAFDQETGKVRDNFSCPECSSELTKRSLEQRKVNVRLVTGETIERIDLRPVRIHYRIGKTKCDKALDESDHEILRRITTGGLKEWAPSHQLPYMYRTHNWAIPARGMTHIHTFWPDRSLATLSALWAMVGRELNPLTRLALKFWVEQAFWGLSWMNRYRPDGFSQVAQYQSGVYYIPSQIAECSPWYNLEGSSPNRGKRQNLVGMWRQLPAEEGEVLISTGSSTTIDLPDDSVDYIFTDPPFGFNFYYADLAHVVESWHSNWTERSNEAIVNQSNRTPRSVAEYQELIGSAFAEYARVLKPGRWLTVEFSNKSTDVWLAIQEAIASAGFVVADTRVFDKKQNSFSQVKATNAVKRDLLISAYKPTASAASEIMLSRGTEESAWSFVREHLQHLPVTQGRAEILEPVRERFADRIYDRMVAYHVHNTVTVPVTVTEFYSGLERLFPERDDMYFLEYQVEEYERKRLTVRELVQSDLFITSESSAVSWLRQFLKRSQRSRRRHPEYSEIQPDYFREMQEGLPDYEELPELRALLDENFLQDEAGGWYVPDPKKAEDLDKLRRRSLLSEFERYVSTRGKLERFRTEALKAGFDDAWDRDEYEVIVSVGSRIPSEVFAEDQALLFFFDNAKQLAKA